MDDPSTPAQLTLACRYIPHDQWLLTHINPTWKIRDVKLYILSKCLNTPFETPAAIFPVADTRPKSPIVFADPHNRPISPIKFAAPKPGGGVDRGGGNDDDWDGDGYDSDDSGGGSVSMHGGLVAKGGGSAPYRSYVPRVAQSSHSHQHHVRSSSLSSIGGYGSSSGHRTSHTAGPSSSHGHSHSQHSSSQPALQPYHFTLLRFSTSQLLEDDFRLADYELSAYELIEMHCSYPFPQPSLSKSKYLPVKRLITPLPRFDINAYIQPYWEGWVRALRVVWRDDAEWYDYAMGTYSALGNGVTGAMVSADGVRRESEDGKRGRTKLEWRERWVVIKDGVLLLCKDREDLTPTHKLRLSSLAELRGAEHLAKSTRSIQARRKRTGVDKNQNIAPPSLSPPTSSFHGIEHGRSDSPPLGNKNDRTYIPGSKEEADRAGLKIVCAKFWTNERRTTKDAAVKEKAEKDKKPKYTSTGPSLSLLAGPSKAGGGKKKKGNRKSSVPIPAKEPPGKHKEKEREKERESEFFSPQVAIPPISRVNLSIDQHNKNQGPYLRKSESFAREKGKQKSGSGKLGMSGLFGGRKNKKGKKETETVSVVPKGSAEGPVKLVKSMRTKEKAMLAASHPASSEDESAVRPDEDVDSDMARPLTDANVLNDEVTRVVPRSEDYGDDSSSSGGHASEDEAAPPGSASDSSLTLSSPVFAHTDTDDDDDGFFSDETRPSTNRFGGYRYGYVPTRKGDKERERELGRKEEIFADGSKFQEREAVRETVGERRKDKSFKKDKNDEKGEWVVLDLRDDNAYTSLLRILHRHFSNPIISSFVPTLSTSFPPQIPASPEATSTIINHSVGSSNITAAVHASSDDAFVDNPDRETNPSSQFEPSKLEHPSILDSLAGYPSTSGKFPSKIFGALPYPEWRIELVKRAQKAGLGDIGKGLEALRCGISTIRPSSMFLDQMHVAQPGGSFMTRDSDSLSGASALTEKPRPSSRSHKTKSTSDDEPDSLNYMFEVSDSEEESSEAEWQAWMADLHRQIAIRSRGQLASLANLEKPTLAQTDDDAEDNPPRTFEDDLLQAINHRRKLEPSGIVITSNPSSPFSSAFSSMAGTPPRQPTSQRHATNRTLRQSVSMHAEQLRSEASELSSGRRPSMPILTAEQTFSLSRGVGPSMRERPNMLIVERSAVMTAGDTTTSYQFPAQPEDSLEFVDSVTATTSTALRHSSKMSSSMSLRKDVTDINSAGPSTEPRRSNSAGVMNAASASDNHRMMTNFSRSTLVKNESKALHDKTQRPRLTVATSSNYEQSETDIIMSPGTDLKSSKLSKRRFMRRVRSGSSLKSAPEDPASPTGQTMAVPKRSKTSLAHGVEKFMNRGVAALDSAMDFVDR